MEPDEELSMIEVYEEDLEAINATLTSVYSFALSYDLFNQYKNLSNKVQYSPLTKQVKAMQVLVQSYLDDAEAAREAESNGSAEEA